MEDHFTSTRTYVTQASKKPKFIDYDVQFIEALKDAKVAMHNPDAVKDAIQRFRSDFGIPLKKRLNKDLKQKWINYYSGGM